MRKAQRSFQQFLVRFPQSPFLQRAPVLVCFQLLSSGKLGKGSTTSGRIPPPLSGERVSLFHHRNVRLYLSESGERNRGPEILFSIGRRRRGFLTADAYYREKEWGKAISSFEEYLSRYPQGKFSLEARFKLASSYLEKGNPDKAQELIKGWEGELQNKFKKDFLPFSIKLHAQKEEWSKVKEEILRLEKETGELGEEYSLLLALSPQ